MSETKKLDLHTSGEVLTARIKKWFEQTRPQEKYYFIESGKNFPTTNQMPVSFILFGDFLMAISEWIALGETTPVIFYVLSHRSLKVIQTFYPDLEYAVEVIPRYVLFPVTHPPKAFPTPKEDWELIFSGRISPSKNILLLLHTVSELQITYGENVRLKIIGEYDDIGNLPHFLAPFHLPHQMIIAQAIKLLKWTHSPEIIHEETSDSWTQHLREKSVLISLSTNWAEDFGVSMAQAETLGTPLIFGNIGGHADIHAENALRIPLHLMHDSDLAYYLDAYSFPQVKSMQLAKFIHERKSAPQIITQTDFTVPLNAQRFAPHLDLLNQQGIFLQHSFKFIPGLPNNIPQQQFWSKYYDVWGGLQTELTETLIVASPVSLSWDSIQHTFQTILGYWSMQGTSISKLSIMHSHQPKKLRKHLTKSLKRVVFIGFHRDEKVIAQTIRDFLPDVTFLIYVFEQPLFLFSSFKETDFTSMFGLNDSIIVNTKRDKNISRLSFKDINVTTCHYYQRPRSKPLPFKDRKGGPTLFYGGRIAEHKGLHHVLWAMSLLHTKGNCPNLEIAGKEDLHSTRHLETKSQDYLFFLYWLIEKLGLKDKVIFRGYILHHNLLNELSTRKLISVSASVQQDENFGLSIAESLTHGCLSVLTDWGGHENFIQDFPDSVFTVKVSKSQAGLQVNPVEFAHAIEKALSASTSFESLKSNLPPHIQEIIPLGAKLASTEARSEILLRRENSPKFYSSTKFFDRVEDEAILEEMRQIYGAKTQRPPLQSHALISPWVIIDDKTIWIQDPSMADNHLKRENPGPLSSKEFEALVKLGQVYGIN